MPKFVQDDEILVDVLFEKVYLSFLGMELIGVVNIQCIRKSTWCACNLAGQVRISFSASNQYCSYIVHPRTLTWIPKIDGLEKVVPFKYGHFYTFLVSMLNLWRVFYSSSSSLESSIF